MKKRRKKYMTVTWVDFVFFAIVIVLILLPPRLDPAIRLKEWTKNWGRKRNENSNKIKNSSPAPFIRKIS
jgi:hypothetical protein